jgi:hypothetical protein
MIFGRVIALAHIPNIKSISQSIAKKSGHNCFISELWTWVTLNMYRSGMSRLLSDRDRDIKM